MQSSIDWANFLKNNVFDFNEIDVIIGSEQYVKYMADYIRTMATPREKEILSKRMKARQLYDEILKLIEHKIKEYYD